LAQALCLDETVRDAFPDGIFWFTLGKEYRLTFEQSLATVPGMKEMVGGCKGEEACLNQYRNALRNRTALIVLDDVWRPDHIEPFRIDSSRSRLLITTRDAELADAFRARSFTATAFASGEARVLLAQSAGLAEGAQLPPEADSILDECHNSPLAISVIGAELRNKSAAHWNNVLDKLREPGAFSQQQVPVARDRKVFQAIHVSFEALRQEDSAAAERYVALGICPEDAVITAELQQLLWNLDASQALETSEKLVRLGLAQRYGRPQDIRLHDFQTDYVRSRFGDQNTLGLIREAVRLSAHATDKYPLQFASQWIGRLINRKEMPGIDEFIQHLVETAPVPWLQPLRPALEPPGTTLYLTLTGHSSGVNEVAITPDGRFAASASYDRTVGVWDLEFGRLRHALRGHEENVTTVAISADGRRALSAAWDGEARFLGPDRRD
jgi:hypothetical protein